MTDNLTKSQRKHCMQSVRGQETSPELRVRKLIHALGFRYALHSPALPGKPDIVLASRQKIIFVHGCFWHKHICRHGKKAPATNIEYWNIKRERNADRDRENIKELKRLGWRILVIWECWTRDIERLRARLESFLLD